MRTERLMAASGDDAGHSLGSIRAKFNEQDMPASELGSMSSGEQPMRRTSDSRDISIPEPDADRGPSWGFVPIVVGSGSSAAPFGPASNSGAQPMGISAFKNATGSARRLEKRDAAPPNAEHQQADDIQIHIGRIEVLAVTQPASRPAPPQARKGLSLDEYLRRRNGRVG